MQEEYEKQLRDNDETKSQALEELTEFYEAKLQEKTGLLEEVSQGATPLPPVCEKGQAWFGLGVGQLEPLSWSAICSPSHCVQEALCPGSPVWEQEIRFLPSRHPHLREEITK